MVGDERTSSSATRDHVHHRSFDFQEISRVQVVADVVDNLGTLLEHSANIVVQHEVQVALAVTSLLILQAVERLGDHVQARGQHTHGGGENGELTLLTLTRMACHTNDVTTAQALQNMIIGALSLTSALRTIINDLKSDKKV